MKHKPYYFDEFFASGKEESISPFLTPKTRKLSKNLLLKSSLLAAFCLTLAFIFSFYNRSLSHIFLVFVYFLVGTPALINTLEDLKKFVINIDVLMTLAALLSVLINSAMEGALLLVLFELSGAMENMVIKKTKSALYALHHIAPKKAKVLRGAHEIIEKSIYDIEIGTLILIKAGEVVPLDGEVVDGSSYVNLVHLTGESNPVAKKKGDEVASGSSNLDGTLTLKVTRLSSDSTISRIIKLITQAQESKPKLEGLLDRFGKWYAPIIIALSSFFALFLPHILGIDYLGIEGSIYRALTFLITASPCALIIATPTAYLSAISSCAKKGILLKGGTVLDAIEKCKVVAFDKTGTLTTGALEFIEVFSLFQQEKHFSTEEVLQVAATLEKGAVHPIAQAIIDKAYLLNLSFLEMHDFKQMPGYGLSATIKLAGIFHKAAIGHLEFIDQVIDKKQLEEWKKQKAEFEHSLYTSCFLLIDSAVFVFLFKDAIRKEAKNAIAFLHKEEIYTCMLTGDHSQNAQAVASELQIKKAYSNLRPDDKLQVIEDLAKTRATAMVGDGINDAPALARATVGMSMGKIGSHAAISASDVVFLHDDLSLIKFLFTKASATSHVIKENLFLSLGVILMATTPALLGYIPLWLAVILHEGGTVIVGLNSLRLLKK